MAKQQEESSALFSGSNHKRVTKMGKFKEHIPLSIKRFYWDALQEFKVWQTYLIFLVPGKIGQKIRAWYLKKICGACGSPVFVDHNVIISSPEKLFLGNNVGIGAGAFITAGGKVTVGNYVGIGPDAKIWSVNHIFKDPHTPWMEQGAESKEVIVGNDVWIGAGSIIKPGVNIGDGAIISAGTVLSKSIPPFALVAGNPGRVVGWRKPPQASE